MCRVFFLTIGSLLPFLASAEGGWKVAGQSGQQQWVLIDNKREKDTDLYQTAIDKLCAGKSFCYVLFWSDPKMVPTSLPMSDAQSKGCARAGPTTRRRATGSSFGRAKS